MSTFLQERREYGRQAECGNQARKNGVPKSSAEKGKKGTELKTRVREGAGMEKGREGKTSAPKALRRKDEKRARGRENRPSRLEACKGLEHQNHPRTEEG